MFFGKKKKAKKAAEFAARWKLLDGFEVQLSEAECATDAGERLLKLKSLQREIQNKIEHTRQNFKLRARGRGFLTYLGGSAVSATTGLAFLGPAGVLIVIPGVIGSLALANKNADILEKKYLKESSDFMEALENWHTSVSEAADKVLNGPLEPIAKSSCRNEVFEMYPDLQKRFAEAAVKKILDDAAHSKPVGGKPGFNL